MKLPINFPDEGDVVRDDAAQFRTLSPDKQLQAIDSMFRTYHELLRICEHPEFVRHHAQQQEALARANIREFPDRYAKLFN